MKYFLDTEFSERGPLHPIQLISIGIVAEDGRELYLISGDYDDEECNDWVKSNVLPHVAGRPRLPIGALATEIRKFVGDDKPEFWGYYADYDWVVFCQLFGAMIDLPKGWPMFCRDLKQLACDKGNPTLPAQSSTEHDALNDARWNAQAYRFLVQMANDSVPQESPNGVNLNAFNA